MKMQDARILKQNNDFEIHRALNMGEILEKSSKAADLLAEYGLHCTSCFLNSTDTVEGGARMHGMSDEEIDSMIYEINTELAKLN